MDNFKNVFIKINGSMVKELASRKRVVLETLRGRISEQMEDVKRANLFEDDRDEIKERKEKNLKTIDASINFCNVMIDFIHSETEYQLSLTELNFLRNERVLSYE